MESHCDETLKMEEDHDELEEEDEMVNTLSLLGNFFPLFCRLLFFFKISFFEKFFQEYHLSVKQFGSRSGPPKCWA